MALALQDSFKKWLIKHQSTIHNVNRVLEIGEVAQREIITTDIIVNQGILDSLNLVHPFLRRTPLIPEEPHL